MREWTKPEEELLRRRYESHTCRELAMALAAEGHKRSVNAVRNRLSELGIKKAEKMSFSLRLTVYCQPGDSFISKVEKNLRQQETPYIVVCDEEGRQAIFRQPINGRQGYEPVVRKWVRWYNHPAKGTWPY